MNILFISIAWPTSGNKNLYTDLMGEFVRRGHNVFVIGTTEIRDAPNYELKNEDGIDVLRINSGKIRKTSYINKFISLLTLGNKIFKGIKLYFGLISVDLIIAPTPPITLSRLYRRLKKKFDAPFYLLLKDMWPQGSVDLGVIRKYGIPWMYLRFYEIDLYKTADYIGCMSPKGVEYILSNNSYLKKNKVEVCPNSIKPQIKSQFLDSGSIREKYNIPKDACVFIFSGNLGIGHGLSFLVETIKELSNYPKAYFVIGGSGTYLEYLQKEFDSTNSCNVFLYSWLPKEDFEQILQTSDVGLILLHKYTNPQFPSRLLSYLNYSKPVLCAVNKYTDIGSIVEEVGCGFSVEHGDKVSFKERIKYFAENDTIGEEMGKNSRKLLMDEYQVSQGYDIIMGHFSGKTESNGSDERK